MNKTSKIALASIACVLAFAVGCGRSGGHKGSRASGSSGGGGGASGGGGAPPAAVTTEWTFMVYMGADNDLERAAIADLDEMEAVGSTDRVNVLVEVDTQSVAVGGNVGTKRLRIEKRPGPGVDSPVLVDLGEQDTNDWWELVDFVDWCVRHYPAKRYALVLWDHGAGWQGVVQDESSANPDELISETGIALALQSIRYRTGGLVFDLIGFDACLMASIEVDTAIAPYARYRVASEEIEPGSGWAYDALLSALVADPSMSAPVLARHVVDTYHASLSGEAERCIATMSVVELEQTWALARDIDLLSLRLQSYSASEVLSLLASSRRRAIEFGSTNGIDPGTLVDLASFVERVRTSATDPGVIAACDAVIQSLDKAVIYKVNGVDHRGAGGVNVYFPALVSSSTSNGSSAYTSTLYGVTSRWYDFVDRYETALLTDRRAPQINVLSYTPQPPVLTAGTQLDFVLSAPEPDVARRHMFVFQSVSSGQVTVVDAADLTGVSAGSWDGLVPIMSDGVVQQNVSLIPTQPGSPVHVALAELYSPVRQPLFILVYRDPNTGGYEIGPAFYSPDGGVSFAEYPLEVGDRLRTLLIAFRLINSQLQVNLYPSSGLLTWGPSLQIDKNRVVGSYTLGFYDQDNAGNTRSTAISGISVR